MNRRGLIALVAVAGLSAMFPVRAALSDPTQSQVDALVEDINAHKQLCHNVTNKHSALYKQCSNEQTALLTRQKTLGLSNNDLNTKLGTHGWRWP